MPEVAAGEPLVSDDGRTYRFRIRPGFRFSPPSNEPVTAAAFERTLERVLSPAIQATVGFGLGDIVGADDYMAGRTKTLEGVDARNRTLVIRLTRPVPNLPARLAMPQYSARSRRTRRTEGRGDDPVPSAGPYYVDSYVAGRGLVLRRNPNYGGERPQRLEEIRVDYDVPAERGVEAVEAGRADYVAPPAGFGAPPVLPQVADRLATRYGPGSEAAHAGRQQLFTQTAAGRGLLRLQHPQRPVHGPAPAQGGELRDRSPRAGGGHRVRPHGQPTDQYIPPGFPGFDDAEIYPLDGPDLATARRLAGDERHHAVLYTCNRPGCIRNAQILQSNLDAIGIDLEVQQFPGEEYFASSAGPDPPWDLASWGWIFDYSDPSNFINNQFGPGAEHPGNFRDPGLWRRMAAAARLTRRGAAARLRAGSTATSPRAPRLPRRTQRHRHPLPLRAHGLPGAAAALRPRPRGALRQGRRRGGVSRRRGPG